MAGTCSACRHKQRGAIDEALARGESVRDIAGRFKLSKTAVDRHGRDHLTKALAKAEAAEVVRADDLLSKIDGLEADANRIRKAAEKSGDLRTALAGLREVTRIHELVARMQGELRDKIVVNLIEVPEYLQLRSALLQALAPYPDARAAVVNALARHG